MAADTDEIARLRTALSVAEAGSSANLKAAEEQHLRAHVAEKRLAEVEGERDRLRAEIDCGRRGDEP